MRCFMGKQDIRLAVEYIDPHSLKANKRNLRKHPASQIEELVKAIQQFGFTQPVLIDSSLTIIAGHARVEAAQQAELAKVPVIKIDHLTKEQLRALMLADNRLSDASTFDMDLLAKELGELAKFDIAIPGFTLDDITEIQKRKDFSMLDDLAPLDSTGSKQPEEIKIVLIFKRRLGAKIQAALNEIDENPSVAVAKLLKI